MRTIADIEKARAESAKYERHAKAPLFFLVITFIPIVLILLWLFIPNNGSTIIFALKSCVAGLALGLMLCDVIASLLAIRHQYWICVVASIVFAIIYVPTRFIPQAHAILLLQIIAVLVVIVATVIVFYWRYTGISNRSRLKVAFAVPLFLFILLYVQMGISLLMVHNFGKFTNSQLYLCALYLVSTMVYRDLTSILMPERERAVYQIISVCCAAISYRMLFLYFDSWALFASAIGIELVIKWLDYTIHLNSAYFSVSTRLHEYLQRNLTCCKFYVEFDSGSNGESDGNARTTKTAEYHAELSSKFFVQTHADVVFGLGLLMAQAVMIFSPWLNQQYTGMFGPQGEFAPVVYKYCMITAAEIVNFSVFSIVMRKVGKIDFQPISDGCTALVQHNTTVLFTHSALYLLIFVMYYHV